MVAIPEDLFYLNSFISLTAMIKKTAHWIQFPDIFFYFGDIRCTDSIQHRFDIKVKQMSASSKDHRIYKINFKGVNIILKTNLDNTFIREWQVLLFLDQERKKNYWILYALITQVETTDRQASISLQLLTNSIFYMILLNNERVSGYNLIVT